MGITGKYDFKGLKKLNALGMKAFLSGLPAPFSWLASLDALLELIGNWAANKGLVMMNLGAIVRNGAVDQKFFDEQIEAGWSLIEAKGRSDVTPEEGARIDEQVREAARRFIALNPRPIGKPKRLP